MQLEPAQLGVLADRLSMLTVTPHFRWRPQPRDPDHDMVLEAAGNARADALVTFNRPDFALAAKRFRLTVWQPADLLRKLGTEYGEPS